MRESGFTEVRWYHGQIVRPKLIEFLLAWGFFIASQNKEDKSSPHSGEKFYFVKQGGLYEIRKISR